MGLDVERELLRKCRAGDWKSYEPIVRAYEDRVFAMAFSLLRNEDDARDMVQDTFIRAFQAMELYDSDRPFIGWLLGICRNMCIDNLRRRRHPISLDRERDGRTYQLPDPAARTDRHAWEAEVKQLIWKALGKISEDHREVIVLKDLQGLEYAEIARIINVPQGTVASRVFYARKALREVLEKMGVRYP
jgi:RNA polymerase sigma-70 factor (ECF subfamily)